MRRASEPLEMRVRRVHGRRIMWAIENFAGATVLLITFGSPYHDRVNGMPHSLVAEVESRRYSQVDNIL